MLMGKRKKDTEVSSAIPSSINYGIEQGVDTTQVATLPTRGTQNTFLPETPGVNPGFFNAATMNQGVADNTGLTSSEHAFLDDQEKMMRLRQRGMA